MRLKIDWASLILRRKFTVFLCFTLYLKAISKYKPPGGLYLEGRFNGGFFALRVWGGLYLKGLIHGGAYFRNFTVPLLYRHSVPVQTLPVLLNRELAMHHWNH